MLWPSFGFVANSFPVDLYASAYTRRPHIAEHNAMPAYNAWVVKEVASLVTLLFSRLYHQSPSLPPPASSTARWTHKNTPSFLSPHIIVTPPYHRLPPNHPPIHCRPSLVTLTVKTSLPLLNTHMLSPKWGLGVAIETSVPMGPVERATEGESGAHGWL